MKDESMVEVVARAIVVANATGYYTDAEIAETLTRWDSGELSAEIKDRWLRLARSCLQALLDHAEDEEMLKAGELAVSRLWEPADSTVAYAAFRAMISKALGK